VAAVPDEFRRLGHRDSDNHNSVRNRPDNLQTEEIIVARKELSDGSFFAPVFVEVPSA